MVIPFDSVESRNYLQTYTNITFHYSAGPPLSNVNMSESGEGEMSVSYPNYMLN